MKKSQLIQIIREEIANSQNMTGLKKYKVEYWYQYMDDSDFDVIEVEAESEEQAIEKAKQQAPRRSKSFSVVK